MPISQKTLILRLLLDGPGTAAEISAETGIDKRSCAHNLRCLWVAGRIDRGADQILHIDRSRGDFLYGLPGTLRSQAVRPQPRAKRVREKGCGIQNGEVLKHRN